MLRRFGDPIGYQQISESRIQSRIDGASIVAYLPKKKEYYFCSMYKGLSDTFTKIVTALATCNGDSATLPLSKEYMARCTPKQSQKCLVSTPFSLSTALLSNLFDKAKDVSRVQ